MKSHLEATKMRQARSFGAQKNRQGTSSTMLILGLETSCDETAAAVVKARRDQTKILSNIIASQAKIHQLYGGVVPEVAARNHIVNILPVIQQALTMAQVTPEQLDAIAVTQGPGLMVALQIGVETAKALAWVWHKPLVGVNHLAGHIYSTLTSWDDFKFPLIGLIASGGHTQLVLMHTHFEFHVIGQTLDDAAGEAFDKVAKHLGLPYPGGPSLSQEASPSTKTSFSLPRPMIKSPNFNFSFSGLKTAVIYYTREHPNFNRSDVCAEFQKAVVETLVTKTLRAVDQYQAKTLVLGGGVTANTSLRQELTRQAQSKYPALILHWPREKTSLDNAAMIALAGWVQSQKLGFSDWRTLTANPKLNLHDY